LKLMGNCKHCDRDFLLTQLLEPSAVGRCPWCGSMLVHNYTVLTPRLIDEAESGGQNLERALRLLSSGWAGFQINGSSVLAPLEAALLDRDVGAQGDKASAVDAPSFETEGERAA
jgi:hypothetical protein